MCHLNFNSLVSIHVSTAREFTFNVDGTGHNIILDVWMAVTSYMLYLDAFFLLHLSFSWHQKIGQKGRRWYDKKLSIIDTTAPLIMPACSPSYTLAISQHALTSISFRFSLAAHTLLQTLFFFFLLNQGLPLNRHHEGRLSRKVQVVWGEGLLLQAARTTLSSTY